MPNPVNNNNIIITRFGVITLDDEKDPYSHGLKRLMCPCLGDHRYIDCPHPKTATCWHCGEFGHWDIFCPREDLPADRRRGTFVPHPNGPRNF